MHPVAVFYICLGVAAGFFLAGYVLGATELQRIRRRMRRRYNRLLKENVQLRKESQCVKQ